MIAEALELTQEPDIDIAELTALADGSLPGDRAAELRRRIADDPRLAAAFARQERTVQALRSTTTESAPARLTARVRGLDSPPEKRSINWRVPAGALAAVVLALFAVFALRGGDAGDFEQLAALASEPATIAAPLADSAEPLLLDLAVDDVAFPAWERDFDLQPSGARADEVAGNEVQTVFYGDEANPIAYTIADADLPVPDDAQRLDADSEVAFWALADGSGITWQRKGKTCVLSGGDLDNAELMELAMWAGGGAVAF